MNRRKIARHIAQITTSIATVDTDRHAFPCECGVVAGSGVIGVSVLIVMSFDSCPGSLPLTVPVFGTVS